MAFVVLDSGRAARRRPRSSSGRAREMANYKVPRFVEFVDALPVNATGKVVKDELRARACHRDDRRTEDLMARTPVAEGIFTWPSRRAAADREPVHGVRDRHVPDAGLVPALRGRPGWPSSCSRGGAGCGRGRRRTSRRRRRRTRGRRATTFVPFGVGYVELPGEVKVETRLTESDPEALAAGMEMELVVVPFRTDDDGNEVVTFAFRPVTRGAHGDGRRDRRRRAAPVRPLRRRVRASRWARSRSGARWPTPGVEWRDIQFAFGGSYEVDNPDAVVALHGPHRDPVHRRLQRLRDRGERADARRQHDPARRARPRHRGRHGQAPARRVQRRSAPVRVPVVVRRARPVPHDEVLRDEDQQVHARPRDLAARRSPRSRRRTTATAR